MQQLVYSFERVQCAGSAKATHPIVGDVIVGVAMAAVGIPGLQRRVEGTAEVPSAIVSFANDRSLSRFNLRIENALAARGLKITKIRVVPEIAPLGEQRAVA